MKISEAIRILKEAKALDNLSLLFYKWGIWVSKDWKISEVKGIGEINKKSYLQSVKRILGSSFMQAWKPYEIAKEIFGNSSRSFTLRIGYRLVVGMGYPSPVENGFLFHHTYAIPYIPGEALKGVSRSALLTEVFSYLNIHDEKEVGRIEKSLTSGNYEDGILKNIYLDFKQGGIVFVEKGEGIGFLELYRTLFGDQKQRGEVVFYDAFPTVISKNNLELDIMNPHYSNYYASKNPPADWDNPNPIVFLTLADVSFRFQIAYYPLEPMHEKRSDYILDIAQNLIEYALVNYGVGGKTRLGYGWFSRR